jgi:hypothetical protein
MTRYDHLKGLAWVEGEQAKASSTIKMILATILSIILAFLLGFLVLSPAILGTYWEIFLPK